MLHTSDRNRLATLRVRLQILDEARTNEAKIRNVIAWIMSDWQDEINELESEDSH